jgi:hypothetical protein
MTSVDPTASAPGRHLSAVVVDRFARGALGPAAAPAVELHLEGCAACRNALNATATGLDADRTAGNWLAVVAELDAPRRSLLERALVRLSVPPDTVRLMGATPALRRSWFVAIFIALLFGVAAASPDRRDATLIWLLALAPLIPVLGVALAYGPGVDPSHEITVAAPMSGFRLVLVRATTVLGTSLVLGGAVSLLMLPRHDAMVAAWLLPALALSLVCLTLMTVVESRVAAAIVTGAWLVVIVGVSANATDQLVLFRGAGQIVFAAVAVLGAAAVYLRRRTFDAAPEGLRS